MNRKVSGMWLFILLSVLFCYDLSAQEDEQLAQAKKLFEKYVALEHSFDPKAADLYDDKAVIQNKRTYPSGEVKVMTIPAPKYKQIIRDVMPLAKARGDISTYSNLKYSVEGTKVRITSTRYSELKKYSSPLSLLAGPNAQGEWVIYEELSESQP